MYLMFVRAADDFYGEVVGTGCQQFPDRATEYRMDKKWRDLFHWSQGKSPVPDFRMGNHQIRFFYYRIIKKQNINIDDSRAISGVSDPTHFFFDSQESDHPIPGIQ